jgi:hypothetical protein
VYSGDINFTCSWRGLSRPIRVRTFIHTYENNLPHGLLLHDTA